MLNIRQKNRKKVVFFHKQCYDNSIKLWEGVISMLERAMELAKKAFEGKTDPKGQPYLNHSVRVMEKMDTEEEKTVAMLHDIVEDSDVTLRDLQDAGFPRDVLEAVEQLTKKPNMTYFDYIEDIASSELAKKVKLAEIDDNMDEVRVAKMSFKTFSLEERRERVKKIFLNEVG